MKYAKGKTIDLADFAKVVKSRQPLFLYRQSPTKHNEFGHAIPGRIQVYKLVGGGAK